MVMVACIFNEAHVSIILSNTTTFRGKIIYCIYHWLYLHILPIVINYDICGDAFCIFYPLYNSLPTTLHRLLSDHLHLCIMGLFTHDFMIFICLHFRYVGSTTIVFAKINLGFFRIKLGQIRIVLVR